MNLYETLGIQKGATHAQIKTAYHKKAKQHHPDKGGDVEAFKQIQRAYEVLSDPERRSRYDEFGDDSPCIDNGDRDLWAELMMLMTQVIDQAYDVTALDVVGCVTGALQNLITQGQQTLTKNERLVHIREQVISRLSRKEGEDILSAGLQSQIDQLHAHSEEVRAQIARLEQMQALVAEYCYSFTPQPPARVVMYGSSTQDFRRTF